MADYPVTQNYHTRLLDTGGQTWATYIANCTYAGGKSGYAFNAVATFGPLLYAKWHCDANADKYDEVHRTVLRWQGVIPAATYSAATVTIVLNAFTADAGLMSPNVVLVEFDGTAYNTGDWDAFKAAKLSNVVTASSNGETLTFTLNAAGLALLNANVADFRVGICLDEEQPNPTEPTWTSNDHTTLAFKPNFVGQATPPTLSLTAAPTAATVDLGAEVLLSAGGELSLNAETQLQAATTSRRWGGGGAIFESKYLTLKALLR